MADPRGNTRRVRVLSGPLRGVTQIVGERLDIGRGASSDLLLVQDGISRQHARIELDAQGRHVLVDLGSSNGTFVDGARIDRHVLTEGCRFEIVRVELCYEATEAWSEADPSGVFVLDQLEGDAPSDPPPEDETGRSRAEADVPQPRGARRSSGRSAQRTPPGVRHLLIATRADGSTYPGSLVDDVVEYRRLRTRIDRDDPVESAAVRAFERLGQRLRIAPAEAAGSRRIFLRFQCELPAALRFEDGSERSATVLDMGVDGAKLRVVGHEIEHDSIVWLAIHLVSYGRPETMVFTSRVVWTCRDHVGLGFAGTPDWEQHTSHRKIEVRTHMDLGEQVRAAREALGRNKPS